MKSKIEKTNTGFRLVIDIKKTEVEDKSIFSNINSFLCDFITANMISLIEETRKEPKS